MSAFRTRCARSLVAAATLLLSVHSAVAPAAVLRAGAAKIDITPDPGVSLDGPIAKGGPVQAVHDPLHARALVLDDGRTRIALVICDLTAVGFDVVDEAKAIVERTSGIPPRHVMIAATHTHAAPRAIHIARSERDDAYHELVSARIAEAVAAAERNLLPTAVGSASFAKPAYTRCRRFVCDPSGCRANPFGRTDDQVWSDVRQAGSTARFAGPVDPEFCVLSIRHLDGSPLAALGNFCVHYAGGSRPRTVSADYFGQFATALEGRLRAAAGRPSFVGLMSNGTSGDTGSLEPFSAEAAPFEFMKGVGRELADDAAQAIDGIVHHSDATLAVATRELELGVRKPDAARLAWADAVLANPQAKHPHPWTPVYAREARELERFPATVRILVQAFRIGDTAVAAVPCEAFAETGLAIKAASPLERTFTVNLANGFGGYLPPPAQHRLGGYETWPARSSFLEEEAEPKIRNAVVELLDELQ